MNGEPAAVPAVSAMPAESQETSPGIREFVRVFWIPLAALALMLLISLAPVRWPVAQIGLDASLSFLLFGIVIGFIAAMAFLGNALRRGWLIPPRPLGEEGIER